MKHPARPLETHDAPLLAELSALAPRLLGHPLDLTTWPATPSGREVHAWCDGQSVLRLVPNSRVRARHSADVTLVAQADGVALLEAAVDFADRWTPLDRLELALPAEHPAVDRAHALGFITEIRRRDRGGDGRDQLVLGRLRPGFVPRALPPPPVWPARTQRNLPPWQWRPITEPDSEAIQALSLEPTGLFGTLQSPSSSADFYTQRLQRTAPEDLMGLMVVGDALLGIGGLHPTEYGDVRILGMAISADWQGCGVGRVLLGHLLTLARGLALRRIELSVYEDNTRAQGLYTAFGFTASGTRRFDAVRDGGHASSREFALLL